MAFGMVEHNTCKTDISWNHQSRFNRLMDPDGIVDFIFGEEFYVFNDGFR